MSALTGVELVHRVALHAGRKDTSVGIAVEGAVGDADNCGH